MAVTPGDHYLLTASADGTILIWTITDHMGHKLCIWKEIDYSQEVLCPKTYLEEKVNMNSVSHIYISFESWAALQPHNCGVPWF